MRKHPLLKDLSATDVWHITEWGLLAALSMSVCQAETVYRCGDAYSAYPQCASGTAVEVKPHATWPGKHTDKTNTAAQELRQAQALEKQRLQAERQATHTAPMQLAAPDMPPSSASPSEVTTQTHPHHRRKPAGPYFTAVDPSTAHKKKSTAKAVPANPPQ